jgi:hypothetical protein
METGGAAGGEDLRLRTEMKVLSPMQQQR